MYLFNLCLPYFLPAIAGLKMNVFCCSCSCLSFNHYSKLTASLEAPGSFFSSEIVATFFRSSDHPTACSLPSSAIPHDLPNSVR